MLLFPAWGAPCYSSKPTPSRKTARPEHQDNHERDEADRILEPGGDVDSPEGLDDAEREPSVNGSDDASHATEHDDFEGLDGEEPANGGIKIEDRREQRACHAGERGAQPEADPRDATDVHADETGSHRVLRGGTDGQPEIGAHEEEIERHGHEQRHGE